MTLTGDQTAMLLQGARSVPDEARDDYFRMVADALRGHQDRQRNQDVKRAVTAARYKFGGGAWSSLSRSCGVVAGVGG
jgi:hypothetical protein